VRKPGLPTRAKQSIGALRVLCESSVPTINKDRELWRDGESFYSDSIHVTENGAIGINCGGNVIVMTLRQWHKLGLK
jgi:hypothetical protein